MSAKGRPERELRPLRGQRSGGAASVGATSARRAAPSANCAASGGSAAAEPQAWGAHLRAKGRPERELRRLGGQRSGEAASVGVQ